MNGHLVWCLEQCLGLEEEEGTDNATGRTARDQQD